MNPKILKGSCLCGSVQYSVPDEFKYAFNCHCSDCRRATGAAFKPFAGIERSKLSLLGNQVFLFGNSEANHDIHCQVCGSLIYSVVQEGTIVHITLGTLMDTPSLSPQAHIFVSDKADWFEIKDLLPQHEMYP